MLRKWRRTFFMAITHPLSRTQRRHQETPCRISRDRRRPVAQVGDLRTDRRGLRLEVVVHAQDLHLRRGGEVRARARVDARRLRQRVRAGVRPNEIRPYLTIYRVNFRKFYYMER